MPYTDRDALIEAFQPNHSDVLGITVGRKSIALTLVSPSRASGLAETLREAGFEVRVSAHHLIFRGGILASGL